MKHAAGEKMSAMSRSVDRHQLQRVALRLEYATIAWNLGEVVLPSRSGSPLGR